MNLTGKNIDFVGPKALFDPLYIPPVILYRKKEENSLFSILKDSISDDFSMNILYQGIEGIGKKVIINKVLKDLVEQNKYIKDFKKIDVDCKEKTLEEIIMSILSILLKLLNFKLDINTIVNLKIYQLWSILKLATKRLNSNIVIVLKNTEYLEPKILKKLLSFGKELKITIISTINNVLKSSTIDILSHYDYKRKLNYFTYNQLFYIFKQRISLTFSHEIDIELIEFMTDLIFDNYIPIPGKGIDILRDLYPYLQKSDSVNYHHMLEICENHFESFLTLDEFNILTYLSEEDLLNVIFLDNLSNYFVNHPSIFYISLRNIKELYLISCETLEYNKNLEEFNHLISNAKNIGLINSSKKLLSQNIKNFNKTNILDEFYFITISPLKLKAMIDAIFEKNQILNQYN